MQTPGPPARPAQSASPEQGLQTLPLAHTGVVLAQSLFMTHWTQAPAGPQTFLPGVRSLHASAATPSPPQPTHTPAAEQNGLLESAAQSLWVRHSTQVFDWEAQ